MKESLSKAQVSPRDYLFILFHRKKYFLLPAVIVFLTATAGSFFLPKYYQSSVMVLVQEEQVINPLAAVRQVYVPAAQQSLVEQVKTLTEKILNYPQLFALVGQHGLDKNLQTSLELEKLILEIRKRTQVRLRSPEVFEVRFEHRDPKKAQALANSLVKNFIDYHYEKKQNLASVGVEFAESQAEVYRRMLEESERKLYEYQLRYPLQRPGKETDINVSLLINYHTSLTGVRLQVQEAEKELQRLNDQLSGRKPLILDAEFLRSHTIIETLNQQLKSNQIKLDDVLQKDPGSEMVVDIELAISDLQRRLKEETEKLVDSVNPLTEPFLYSSLKQNLELTKMRIEDLKKREQQFLDLVDNYEQKIISLPEQDRVYAQLVRDARVNSNIYEMLRMKVEENRLSAVELQQKGTNYEILEEGRLPLKPSKPQKLIISLVSLVLGTLTGFGCVFLVELSDHSFRNVEDARRYLEIPVIGPTMKIQTIYEYHLQRRTRRIQTIIFVLFFLVFIAAAVIISQTQERRLMREIIREQIESETR